MNYQTAKKIVASEFHLTSGFSKDDPSLNQAKGYLECHTKAQELVETLENAQVIVSGAVNFVGKETALRFMQEALDQWHKENKEGE